MHRCQSKGNAVMLRSGLTAVTLTAAVLLTVTACGGSSKDSTTAADVAKSIASAVSAAPTTSPAASTATTADSSTASATDTPTSDDPSFVNGGAALADTGNLVYVLEAVNPKIGTSKDDLVAKSKALCGHIAANESEGQLEADAAKGFTNGPWVPSDSEAQAIVGTVKAYGGC
jgi:hypothetical protein